MSATAPAGPVVVGIDGSKHALRAAKWAAFEAAGRDTTLRLVSVIEAGDQDSIDRAQRDLHAAWKAVRDTDVEIKLESEIVSGSPAQCLIDESRGAALVCVGDRGTHDSPKGCRGATAAEVARRASGSVAIISREHGNGAFDRRKWIVVIMDESDAAAAVFAAAQDEAQWRAAPVLILEPWTHATPSHEVKHPARAIVDRYMKDSDDGLIQSVSLPMPEHLGNLLRQSASIDQLVIVAGDRSDLVDDLTSTATHKYLRDSDCSLMFVR